MMATIASMRAAAMLLGFALSFTSLGDAAADDFAKGASEETARGGSVSCGTTNRGALSSPAELPASGHGYVVQEPWRARNTRYGTDELVQLIEDASAAVANRHPGALLAVADMSGRQGGALASHRSHQNGRDVDLIYYAIDSKGRAFAPDNHMPYYLRDGVATYARSPRFEKQIEERFFDLKRNWSLVRNLMTHSTVQVEYIFVSPRVKRWLLAYGARIGESEKMLAYAQKVLHAPRSVRGHNDHMHVRIACSKEDIELGRCRNASARPPRRGRKWHRRLTCPQAQLSAQR